MKSKVFLLITLVIILILMSAIAFAETSTTELGDNTEDLNSLSEAVKRNRNISHMLDTEGKEVIFGLSKDLFNIARYVVITALLARALMLFFDFQMAADAPEAKARIKSKALYLTLGLIFSLNFWKVWDYVGEIIGKISLL